MQQNLGYGIKSDIMLSVFIELKQIISAKH